MLLRAGSNSKFVRSGRLKHQLRYWESTGIVEVGEILVENSEEDSQYKKAGIITSVVVNEASSGRIGLALIRSKFLDDKELFTLGGHEVVSIDMPTGFKGLSKVNLS